MQVTPERVIVSDLCLLLQANSAALLSTSQTAFCYDCQLYSHISKIMPVVLVRLA